MIRALTIWLLLGMLASPGFAAETCETGTFENIPYTACRFDAATAEVRLFYQDDGDALIGSFRALEDLLAAQNVDLVVAMNGGMYHPDRTPVGYYVEDGREGAPLIRGASPGNFGMLPNGVFCMSSGKAAIFETERFARDRPACAYATQSGPLMVNEGEIHPRFLPDSTSLFRRNGVGISATGDILFAISDAPVSFHRFARLFRDHLGAPDALYIDGRVSRLYAKDLGRADIGLPMGPILGVVRPRD